MNPNLSDPKKPAPLSSAEVLLGVDRQPSPSQGQPGRAAQPAAAPARFNPWPLGILMAFVVFISGLVAMVSVCTANKMDLVTPNYYEKELRFQTEMDNTHRAAALNPRSAYVKDQRKVEITLPPQHASASPRGTIQFYRPSAAGLDREYKIAVRTDGSQSIDVSSFEPGLWKLAVQWTVNNQEFRHTDTLVIASNTRQAP